MNETEKNEPVFSMTFLDDKEHFLKNQNDPHYRSCLLEKRMTRMRSYFESRLKMKCISDEEQEQLLSNIDDLDYLHLIITALYPVKSYFYY